MWVSISHYPSCRKLAFKFHIWPISFHAASHRPISLMLYTPCTVAFWQVLIIPQGLCNDCFFSQEFSSWSFCKADSFLAGWFIPWLECSSLCNLYFISNLKNTVLNNFLNSHMDRSHDCKKLPNDLRTSTGKNGWPDYCKGTGEIFNVTKKWTFHY